MVPVRFCMTSTYALASLMESIVPVSSHTSPRCSRWTFSAPSRR